MRSYYGSRFCGKSINIARNLTAAYNDVLTQHDLLLAAAAGCIARRNRVSRAAARKVVHSNMSLT